MMDLQRITLIFTSKLNSSPFYEVIVYRYKANYLGQMTENCVLACDYTNAKNENLKNNIYKICKKI